MYSMLTNVSAPLLLLLLPLASCQWGPPHYPHTAPPAPAHPSTSVPQDTPEVAAAKAAHFAAVAKAAAAASGQVTYAPASAYGPAPAPAAQPAPPAPPPVNGVPQDTPEVAAAKAAHFAALAKVAGHRPAPSPTPAPYSSYNPGQYGPTPYPQGPAPYAPGKQYPPAPPPVNGVPQDTPEVAAAKAAHFAAVAKTGGPAPPSPPPSTYYPPAPSPPSYYPPAPTPAPYYPPAPTPAPYYPPAPQYNPAPAPPPSGVPQDTPEVAAAKAAHFAALARVKSAPQPPQHNHWN